MDQRQNCEAWWWKCNGFGAVSPPQGPGSLQSLIQLWLLPHIIECIRCSLLSEKLSWTGSRPLKGIPVKKRSLTVINNLRTSEWARLEAGSTTSCTLTNLARKSGQQKEMVENYAERLPEVISAKVGNTGFWCQERTYFFSQQVILREYIFVE